MKRFMTAFVLCAALLASATAVAAKKKSVKVFLLVGQSNMQGKGSAAHLKELVRFEPEKYGHLMKDGQWIKRDDVSASFHDTAASPLTVGTTTRPPGRVGPEIGFGKVVGDVFDEPVLLLKIAWGGQSLAVDFNPPSRGKWGDREFKYRDGESWKPGSIGWAYQAMFNEMHVALDKTKEAFPELADREFEITGFVWFQGWNDLINAQARAEYKDNMVAFIKDVRKHLDVPNLPFVIGVAGHGGDSPNESGRQFREAQAAPAEMQEFKGNVAAVHTSKFWDPTPHGDGGYHYNGSASFFYDAGVAFGEAMLKLLGKSPVPTLDRDTETRVKAIRNLAESKEPEALSKLLDAVCSEKPGLVKSVAVAAFVERSLASSDLSGDELAGLYKNALNAADSTAEKQLMLGGLSKACTRICSPKAMTLIVSYFDDKDVAEDAIRAAIAVSGILMIDHADEVKPVMEKIVQGSAGQELKDKANAILKNIDNPNLAPVATISNPEGYKQTHRGRGGPGIAVAMDGDMESRWVPEEGKDLYRVRLDFDRPRQVSRIRIFGYRGNRYAPKDFDIVCDGKVVKEVRGADHARGLSVIDFPATKCKTLQLNITGYYAGSPGIRELEVYGAAAAGDTNE